MRISDWSSDVCSSDLVIGPPLDHLAGRGRDVDGRSIPALKLYLPEGRRCCRHLKRRLGEEAARYDGRIARVDATSSFVDLCFRQRGQFLARGRVHQICPFRTPDSPDRLTQEPLKPDLLRLGVSRAHPGSVHEPPEAERLPRPPPPAVNP